MSNDFRLITLGRLMLEGGARDEAGLNRQRRKLAVLAVLALSRAAVSRDVLLEMFWGDQDEARARHSLSDALSHLRRVLGPGAITARRSDVALAEDTALRVDALDLAAAVRAGEDERALALYGGPFLDGVYVGGSPRFEQWVDGERRNLERLFHTACARRCAMLSARESWQECERVARRWLESDPLSRDAAFALLTAVSSAGGHASEVRALETFEAHRRTLVRDYGLEPDAAVGSFAAELRDRVGDRVGVPSAADQQPAADREPSGEPAAESEAAPSPVPSGSSESAGRGWSRHAVRTAAGLAAGAAVVALAVLLYRFERSGPAESPAALAIFPFSLRGGAEYGYLREGMVDLLSTNLDGAAGLRTVDPRAVLAAASAARGPVSSPEQGRSLAHRLDAGLYVLGDIAEAGGRLRMSAALYDVQRDDAVSRAYAEGEADSLFALVDRLTAELLAMRAQRVGGRLGRTAALTTGSIPALKAYLEGEQHWRAMRLVEAVDALRRATRQDSTFALAWYRLGLASSWDARVDVAEEAMDHALRLSGSLSERDRALIAAYRSVVYREPEEAERLYRAVVADYPTDVEAWSGLGEMWFHGNPWRGRSFEESRQAWEQVLRLEPHNVGATWHLAYVSARQGRTDELDTLTQRIQATVAGGPDISIRAIRAVTLGGPAEQEALLPELSAVDDFTLILVVWRVAVVTEDPDAITRFARLLVESRRPAEVRALGHGLLAHLRMARGQRAAALDELDALARIDAATALAYRALFAAFPLQSTPRGEVAALLEQLRRGETAAPRVTSPADLWVNVHADLHPQLRTYLIGVLSARIEAEDDAERSAAALAQHVGDADGDHLARTNAREIRAELLRARGDARRALDTLEAARDNVDYGSARTSPFFARSRQRFLRAELLRAAGRDAEALGWYAGIAQIFPHDILYLAPSYLRRAEILAARGDTDAAVDCYQRFLALWAHADAALQPLVDQAQQALADLQ